jgi:predicted LPLAT superfamily acyltransferase
LELDHSGVPETHRPWTSRSLGSAFQHRIFYALIRLGGRHLAYLILVFVAAWYTFFRPSVRRRSSFYLARRFPGSNLLQSLLHSYRLTFALGKVLVDRAVIGILGPDKLHCSLSERERLKALLDEGHGLILVTSHVGCWQLGMASLGRLEAKINLLIHREAGDVDRHFFEHGDQPPPYRIIDPRGYLGGTLEMLQVLNNREVLCIMGDRVMGGKGSTVEVDFLGGEIAVPFSPYKLASATGAPIAVVFSLQTGPNSFALRVAKIIRVPENLGRGPSAYQPYAKEYVQALEGFVEEFPFQFFNFFDMWTAPPTKPDH